MTPRVVVLTPYFRPIVGGVESNAELKTITAMATALDARVILDLKAARSNPRPFRKYQGITETESEPISALPPPLG